MRGFREIFNRPVHSFFSKGIDSVRIGAGVSSNRINVNIFRHNGITSFVDKAGTLHVLACLVDPEGCVKIYDDYNGMISSNAVFKDANIADAHNSPVIAVDGKGRVHCIIPFHNREAVYLVSGEDLSKEYSERDLPFSEGFRLTYPEFYSLPDGGLVLTARNGRSGDGDIYVARFDSETDLWTSDPIPVISGAGTCSPYIQCCTDTSGRLHISWCWRDSSDVASNHDIMYICSRDSTLEDFTDSEGDPCSLPVTPQTAPMILEVPTGSMLINQTSMCTDCNGIPFIASYWREGGIVRYHILKKEGGSWKKYTLPFRRTDYSDSGVGTRSLPIARPFIFSRKDRICLLIRDIDMNDALCMIIMNTDDPSADPELKYISRKRMGTYEPVADASTPVIDGKIRILAGVTEYSQDNRRIPLHKGQFYILSFDPEDV